MEAFKESTMPSMFESATRVAIEEIITQRAKASKFGMIVTKESLREITDDLYNLLLTSRNLKAAGDRLVKLGMTSEAQERG